ncbi:MAG: hypothetical protein HXS42_04585 [Theionarchaea archaeon]|nr:hypothetical protein [Theionarchaea archaeon]
MFCISIPIIKSIPAAQGHKKKEHAKFGSVKQNSGQCGSKELFGFSRETKALMEKNEDSIKGTNRNSKYSRVTGCDELSPLEPEVLIGELEL